MTYGLVAYIHKPKIALDGRIYMLMHCSPNHQSPMPAARGFYFCVSRSVRAENRKNLHQAKILQYLTAAFVRLIASDYAAIIQGG